MDYDVITYKSVIMNELCSTPDIFTLIDNDKISQPDQMSDNNLFSYMKIPDTTLEVENYICFDVNARSSSYNDLYKNITINMAVVCHNHNIKAGMGNRHDLLGGVVIDILNFSNLLGLQLELVSDTETIWEKEYNVRLLQFKNLTLNSVRNGVRINGIR
jgi:hypothetical protein